uniref:Uncharacterized protein n=1 Tax=Tanacetum cinerariifolium TaxID=118510 RepID=A0A6L2P4A1_TANCI|nr:hypothetical protein [Tanacetum cinerariifolium]
MELYMENRENGRMILNSVLNGPLVWPIVVQEDGTTRKKTYVELSATEKIQADCDLKATNIVLQGLPPDVYAIFNHHKVAKDEKAMLAKALQSDQILDEEQVPFLAEPCILDGQAAQTTIPNNVAFQIKDLDAYDSNCDDVSNAKAVLMANLSNYGSNVISEVSHFEPYHNDMDNQTVQDTNLYAQQDSMILSVIEQMSEQMINHVNNWEKANQEKNNESVTAELERYKERVKNFKQRLNIDLSTHKKMIDSHMDNMRKEKLELKQQIESLEQNLSNQIKEKESLLQTFTVFKNKSKEKESKYMENEIDLEKKIKELDNIVYKVGQSAQTVHILTKPQVFYNNAHKQALGYQNPFYLKKA